MLNDAVCSAAPTPPGRNRTLFHLRQNESLCLWLFLLSRFGVYRTCPRIHHQDLRLRGKSGVRERGDLDLDLHARIVAIAKMNKKKGKCIDKQLHRCIDRSTWRFTTARSVKCITSHQFVTRYRERTDGAEGRGEGRGKGHLAKKVRLQLLFKRNANACILHCNERTGPSQREREREARGRKGRGERQGRLRRTGAPTVMRTSCYNSGGRS